MSQTDIEILHARLEQAEEETERFIPDAAVSKPLRSEDVQRLVQSIDVERFSELPTHAARIRALYSAFGEGRKFRPRDVVRAYKTLDSGVEVPDSMTVSVYLHADMRTGALAKIKCGLWQVLSVPAEPLGLDVAPLVQSIDLKQFSKLPSHAARTRALYSAFGEGTEFRAGDVVRAYRALDVGIDALSSRTVTSQLAKDVKKGLLAKLERGLWQVLSAPVEPPALDVAPLVQSIDLKQFSKLPSHAARTRAIHSAFGEGTEFRPSDVVRAYEALDAGVDAPSSKTVSSQLIQDTKMGLLAKLEPGLWQVLNAADEPPGLDVALLVQSIDVEQFSKLPTRIARVRTLYSAFGEGAEFRPSDVVRAYRALDAGIDAPDSSTVSSQLNQDAKAGMLAKLEPGLWQVLDVELSTLDVAPLVQSIDVERFSKLPTEAARIRMIHSAFGVGTEFRASDVVRAYEALDSGVEEPDSMIVSAYLHADMRTGVLVKIKRGLWQVLSVAVEPLAIDVAQLVQSIDVERFVSLPSHAARIRAIYSVFGEGTVFRPSDVVQAFQLLDAGIDAPYSMIVSNQLTQDAKTGGLVKIKRGLWRVIRAPVEPLAIDVAQLVQSIDVERFVSLPSHAARIRAIYSVFGEGTEFRTGDVVRAFQLLDAGIDTPSPPNLSQCLRTDMMTGLLAKPGRGLWKVLDVQVEVPVLEDVPLVQSIDVGEFASLPTEAARIRAVYSAFGEGAEPARCDVAAAQTARSTAKSKHTFENEPGEL